MSYTLVRATVRTIGLLRTTTHSCNGHIDPLLFKTNNIMAASSASKIQQQTGLKIHGIRALNQDESKYVRPMRFHFTLNGRERIWDCLKAHDSVACVLYNKTRNKLIYVKQFRPAVYLSKLTAASTDLDEFDPTILKKPAHDEVGYTLELCAGLVDKKGKSTQEVMQEEIIEETGYKVSVESIQFISSFRGSTGLSGTLMNLYFCEVTDDQRQNAGGGLGDESIEVVELSVDDARKAIYCSDDESPFSRPPAMLFGTTWFLYEYLPKQR